jgi:hypothetical protein
MAPGQRCSHPFLTTPQEGNPFSLRIRTAKGFLTSANP